VTATSGIDAAEATRLAGRRALRTYHGLEPTDHILAAIRDGLASGVTLFRADNIGSPADVLAACEALQAARPAGDPPLVIGIDQEGGQLQAVGYGATAWPGDLALGATGSTELARAAGLAIGSEAAAMGATLVYAPDCDVLTRGSATPLGVRSFGADPDLVSRMTAAFVEGLQAAGVAGTLKHFPGHGSGVGDSHHSLPVVKDPAEMVRARDLPPFRAGIAAGALTVMPGHIAVPALSDGRIERVSSSRRFVEGLLRDELGFRGVAISDALDMGGAGDADQLEATVVAAAEAGIDLLLLNHDPATEDAAVEALARAIESGRHDKARARRSAERVLALRARLGRGQRPDLSVVDSAEHRALARQIAEASITLVRDEHGALRSWPAPGDRVAVLAPVPADLTPAETSSYLHLGLADAFRVRGVEVAEYIVPLDPTEAQVAALNAGVADADGVVLGTFDAVSFPGQAALARAVVERSHAVAVALRSPYDAEVLPASLAVVCTYGIQAPQIEALADALLGRIPFSGHLPVALGPGTPAAPTATVRRR
jgi:beta-N-acetylhexosaminidase